MRTASARLLALCVLGSACQTVGARVVLDGPRFTAVQQILIDVDTGIVALNATRGQPAFPQYPSDERSRYVEGHPIVAYVVDTTGRIEPRTLTFLVAVSPGFEDSLCEWRNRIRFHPVRVAGAARRVLVLQAFSFEIGTATKRAPPDVEPFKKHLRAIGSDSAFGLLEGMSACRM
jgi:hypothetical protein